MSEQNLGESLDAVETALAHLVSSLEAAGFAAGATAYRHMADIVMGQRLWAADHGVSSLDEQYRRVGRLATKIYEYLVPYVEVAAQLGTLQEDPLRDALPGLAGEILTALETADRPIPATWVGSMVGASTSTVRKELDALAADGLVETQLAGGRTLFHVA